MKSSIFSVIFILGVIACGIAHLPVALADILSLDGDNWLLAPARVTASAPAVFTENSVRCGFRDFRFKDGAFRLNGRRVYLRSSHTGNCCPIGLELPHDPDLLRRDLLNAKTMGFNAIRSNPVIEMLIPAGPVFDYKEKHDGTTVGNRRWHSDSDSCRLPELARHHR